MKLNGVMVQKKGLLSFSLYRIQEKYIRDGVTEYWETSRQALLDKVKEPLVLCGDGRNDSPGYNSQYCTYSLMDFNTKNILDVQVVDVREAQDKSVNMEKLGFQRAVADLVEKSPRPITEIVTDQHVQIKALMSVYFAQPLYVYIIDKITFFIIVIYF